MITLTILAVAFIAGVIAGIVALLRMGMAREESGKSLMDTPPTAAAAATRRLIGWHGSMPQRTIPLRDFGKPASSYAVRPLNSGWPRHGTPALSAAAQQDSRDPR